jgi:hypothetical protein
VLGTAVQYAVQRPSNSTTVPVVRTGVAARLEVQDTVFVEATDPVGISMLGYEVRSLTGQLLVADSVISTGGFSTVLRTFRSRVPVTVFPTLVTVASFARNANGRRDVARFTSGALRLDTVAVVAGYTSPLPSGGQVADAFYFPRTDRIYLSNIERNWLEVYNLADSTFRAPIAVGSRPWGIAPWPRNRDGSMGDTLLVANSGGTNISYVDLRAGTTGREVFRYALPNIVAYSITTVRAQATDAPIAQRTLYDFSDRPQYLAATCNGADAPDGKRENHELGHVLQLHHNPVGSDDTSFGQQDGGRVRPLANRCVGESRVKEDRRASFRIATQGLVKKFRRCAHGETIRVGLSRRQNGEHPTPRRKSDCYHRRHWSRRWRSCPPAD